MKYNLLKSEFDNRTRRRIVINLLNLKEGLVKSVPSKCNKDNFLIATWNIRDFDSNKSGHGPRLKESFLYIGEILSAFDLIALQEVGEDLSPLERLLHTMGDNWDYIATDAAADSAGKNERMAYVYDRNHKKFDPAKVEKNKKGEVTEKEIEAYFSDKWRSWQMSDHLPLWVELKVDFSMEDLFDMIG